jgi:hypothetical protein
VDWSVSPAWEAVELTLGDRLHLPVRGPRQSYGCSRTNAWRFFIFPRRRLPAFFSKASTVCMQVYVCACMQAISAGIAGFGPLGHGNHLHVPKIPSCDPASSGNDSRHPRACAHQLYSPISVPPGHPILRTPLAPHASWAPLAVLWDSWGATRARCARVDPVSSPVTADLGW